MLSTVSFVDTKKISYKYKPWIARASLLHSYQPIPLFSFIMFRTSLETLGLTASKALITLKFT